MKIFNKPLLILLLIFSANTLFAQKFEVPKDYSFKTKEDYAKYEPDVLSCINWLNKTPFDTEEQEKRAAANKFLVDWVSGSPNVSVEINPKIVTFTETNPDLLPIFMGGWTKYALMNPADMNSLKGNFAGLKAVITYYDKNPALNKDKQLEKLIKLNDKGELRKWVNEQLKS